MKKNKKKPVAPFRQLSVPEFMKLLDQVDKQNLMIQIEGVDTGEQYVEGIDFDTDLTLGGNGLLYSVEIRIVGEDPNPYISDVGHITTDGESVTLHSRDHNRNPIAVYFSKHVTEKVLAVDLL